MKAMIVIQHCQSEHHVNNMTGGWTDTPLTELGRRQAASIGARLKQELVGIQCQIYSSDLKRASQTAEIVGNELGIVPISVPGLREHNSGEATGKTREWAEKHINMDNFSLFDWAGFPGAETWREFYARISNCMDELVKKHDPEVLPIIVTHGGSTSCIVTWWLGLELDSLPERTPFTGVPASINALKQNRYGNHVIDRLNDQVHLYKAGLSGGLGAALNFSE
jgi:probable phosphoglycerate mutase